MRVSFSRRLQYLHDSEGARKIAKSWLSEGGLLGRFPQLDDAGRKMFSNIASVEPVETLTVLERVAQTEPAALRDHFEVLRAIAYDSDLFPRCATLMASVLCESVPDDKSRQCRVFCSLFQLRWSGTLAPVQARVRILESLLKSSDENSRRLGVLALGWALEARHFSPEGSFDFGARPRSSGYWPKTEDDVRNWFASMLDLVETLVLTDDGVESSLRQVLAERFRALWHRGGVQDLIVGLWLRITKRSFWPEGWLATRKTLAVDGPTVKEESRIRLVELETAMRPTDLVQRIRSIVFSTSGSGVNLDDVEESGEGQDSSRSYEKAERLARELGRELANDEGSFVSLLPEMVSCWTERVPAFGEGLGEGCLDPDRLLRRLAEALGYVERERQQPQVIASAVKTLQQRDPAVVEGFLVRSLDDEVLSYWFPLFQTCAGLENPNALARLKRSLELGRAPILQYRRLIRVTDALSADELADLLLLLARQLNGHDVALEILYMRLSSGQDRSELLPSELERCGRELLATLEFDRRNDHQNFRLRDLAVACLAGETGAAATGDLCTRLRRALSRHQTHGHYHDDLLLGLFEVQPRAALDGLFPEGDDQKEEGSSDLLHYVDEDKRPLSAVPETMLLEWCSERPERRFALLADWISFMGKDEGGGPVWTSVALRFLDLAPDPATILRKFVVRFRPSAWSGSLAQILMDRSVLLDQLGAYSGLKATIDQVKEELRAWIADERRWDAAQSRMDERFE